MDDTSVLLFIKSQSFGVHFFQPTSDGEFDEVFDNAIM